MSVSFTFSSHIVFHERKKKQIEYTKIGGYIEKKETDENRSG